MTHTPRTLLLAALIAGACSVASAQTPPPAPTAQPAAGEASARPQGERRHGRMDPAERQKKMAEHRAKRQAELKAALKITPAQEGAWTQFSAAMQPPAAGQRPRMDRAEMEKLTTPQRIDRMQQLHAERDAHMKQRGDAVKAFYAQLSPEQQKVFDERAMRHGGRDGERGGRHGQHHGHGPRS